MPKVKEGPYKISGKAWEDTVNYVEILGYQNLKTLW